VAGNSVGPGRWTLASAALCVEAGCMSRTPCSVLATARSGVKAGQQGSPRRGAGL